MKALLIVDVQKDFLPGGALGVANGDEIVPVINTLQEKFDLVVATKDWHPSDHSSFHEVWPVHCVQNTEGSEFAPKLRTKGFTRVFYKGIDQEIDSYSALFDNAHRRDTGLALFLKERGVDMLYIVGLATDYCVKYSTLDALKVGFEVYVIEDACRAIHDQAGALDEMRAAGAHIISSLECLESREL